MMKGITAERLILLVISVFFMSLVTGCAHLEKGPADKWVKYRYFHKPLPEASRTLEQARLAGKEKECPTEFKAAEDMVDKAYETYNACFTQKAIDMAQEAIGKINALCPAKPLAAAPVIIPMSEPKAYEKVEAYSTEPKTIVLAFEDIHFDFDKSTLTKEAQTILKRNIQVLKGNPQAKVRVAGYASASGTEEYNRKLSIRRAKAVEEYLTKEGLVASDRLSLIGYGETKPAMYEAVPKDFYSKAAKANMRVLFEIVIN